MSCRLVASVVHQVWPYSLLWRSNVMFGLSHCLSHPATAMNARCSQWMTLIINYSLRYFWSLNYSDHSMSSPLMACACALVILGIESICHSALISCLHACPLPTWACYIRTLFTLQLSSCAAHRPDTSCRQRRHGRLLTTLRHTSAYMSETHIRTCIRCQNSISRLTKNPTLT